MAKPVSASKAAARIFRERVAAARRVCIVDISQLFGIDIPANPLDNAAIYSPISTNFYRIVVRHERDPLSRTLTVVSPLTLLQYRRSPDGRRDLNRLLAEIGKEI